jgi:hypothetical protein
MSRKKTVTPEGSRLCILAVWQEYVLALADATFNQMQNLEFLNGGRVRCDGR